MFRQQLRRRRVRPPFNGRRLGVNRQHAIVTNHHFFAVAGVGFEMDGDFHNSIIITLKTTSPPTPAAKSPALLPNLLPNDSRASLAANHARQNAN